jgi:hypothetical protein
MFPVEFTCTQTPLGYCANNLCLSGLLLLSGLCGFVLVVIASIQGYGKASKKHQWGWVRGLILGILIPVPAGVALNALLAQVIGSSALVPLLPIAAGLLLTPMAALAYSSRYLPGTTRDDPVLSAQPGKKASRNWLGITLGVIGAIAVLCDVGLTAIDTVPRVQVRSEVTTVVLSYCSDLTTRDYTAAHRLFSPNLQQPSSLDDFATLDSKFGVVVRCSLQSGPRSDGDGPSVGYTNAQADIQVVRTATCTLTLYLMKEGDGWKIDEYGPFFEGITNLGVPECENYIF